MKEQSQPQPKDRAEGDKSVLDRMARTIDPPSREIDDESLRDPGRATPGAPPTENRS
ncbi:MAG: hypothetical protein JWP36_2265 [Paucimonas sp.]|jgi:hypothetical protein|nr:hypothetical protein [Paucimonas sp.]